ncbi:LOW QUALITY PROTEIN: hypothetical protein V1477_016553 [Vespula maculifrons]|uniref:Uncharacterized protein n=1 Tax=Vespula maculifrons TaxID=7453 RepID=A0ABD2B8L0_VESMC
MRKPKKNFLLGIFPINTRGKVRGARSYVNIGDGVWGLGYYRAFGLKLVDTTQFRLQNNAAANTFGSQYAFPCFVVVRREERRRGGEEERRRGGVGVGVEARAKGEGQNNRRNGKEERVQHHLRKHHVWYIERLIGRDELLHGDPFRETVDRWSSAGCLSLLNEPTRQRKQKCAASEALAMTSRVD